MKTRLTFGKRCATTLAMVVWLSCGPLCAQGKKPPKDDPPSDDPPAATLPTFAYRSLGTLGGATSTAEGINLWGEVVGNADLSDGSSAPYLYTPSDGMSNLNDLTEGPLDVPARTLFGPDGRFYVLNTGLYAGGGSVAVFNPAGDFIEMFVPVDSNGGLENPADMTFGPDGNLYIPSHSGPGTPRNRILQFKGPLSNNNPGDYLGEFVTAESGAVGITQLLFGPDVNDDGEPDLFVCSLRSEEILIFDGVTGEFIKTLVNEPVSRFQLRDGVNGPELLAVTRPPEPRLLSYNAITGELMDVMVGLDTFPPDLELDNLGELHLGPDGDLYFATRSTRTTINGTDDGAQVLRVDGSTYEFVEVFVPPKAGGWSSAAPRLTFDGTTGDLYVNSGDTNQILRFEGPESSTPGAFKDVFVQGVGFVLLTARDINDSGQIVGLGYPKGRRNLTGYVAAYRYTPPADGESVGRVDDLLVPGLNFQEEATAINNSGDVAGHFVSADTNRYHAFLWTAEEGFVDLGSLTDQDTYVTAINDRSSEGNIQLTGFAETSVGVRAWRYDTASGTMQNLGLISGSSGISCAWDLSKLGDVVGLSSAGSNSRAFRFSDSHGMVDLGTLGSGKHSEAFGLNDSGDIVGFTDTDSRDRQNKPQAFLFTTANGMFALEPQITNLPSSMKLKIEPWRISNGRQIIGPGSVGKPNVAYLLTPQPQ